MKNPCIIVDSWCDTIGCTIGAPARIWLRRYHAFRFEVGRVPVYVVRCNEDLQLGFHRLARGVDWLGQTSPVWVSRMPQLLRCIMLLDTVDTTGYYSLDKCCAINPWGLAEEFHDPQSTTIAVGAFLLYGLVAARLTSSRMKSRHTKSVRKRLAVESVLRYLYISARSYDHFEVRLLIDIFKTWQNAESTRH